MRKSGGQLTFYSTRAAVLLSYLLILLSSPFAKLQSMQAVAFQHQQHQHRHHPTTTAFFPGGNHLRLRENNSCQRHNALYHPACYFQKRPKQRTSSISQYRGDDTVRLYSLQRLVEGLVGASSTNDGTGGGSSTGGGPKTVFVGGKGGVGKTTISSALAVHLASLSDNNDDDVKMKNVLIVSTDPAHSLGDALDEDLRKGRGEPVPLTDPVTAGRLFACEADAAAALEDFRDSLASFDVNRLADSLGVSADLLDNLGLREFGTLLNNPPPGLDELVALSNVLDDNVMSGSGSINFDVVVVDTAPTGHTLRLLALPQFLDGLLGKLITLRMKLSRVASTLQSLFGNAKAEQRAKAIDDAADRLEKFRTKMSNVRSRLQDGTRTSFVVVTVPTKLGVAESKRLVSELQSQGVAVTDIVINQCVGDLLVRTKENNGKDEKDEDDDDYDSSAIVEKYYQRRKAGQDRWIRTLQETVHRVSQSEEYKSNGNSDDPIALITVPFFDVELVGIPALAYVGSRCFLDQPSFAHLFGKNDPGGAGAGAGDADETKMIVCGGKGGVGKTTTSAALAVSMAAAGHRVALISTDPAHSLGDAIDMNLAGGKLVECPLVGVPPSGASASSGGDDSGSLSVLEIDPTSALADFKGVVDRLIGGDDSDSDSDSGNGIRKTLSELEEVFDTLPAGTDEVVALAKIVNLVRKGDYNRIVLDTAPTGHTLRMLSTPGFLAEFIDRLLVIADKVNANAAVKMLISTSSRAETIESVAATARSTLLSFQLQMYDLEDMLSDADQTEFVIVTIPTELAIRESSRLLNDLTFEAPDMPIKVRNVVVNQVLSDDGSDTATFLDHMRQTESSSVKELEQSTASGLQTPPVLTRVQYLDTEPRGVFGLKVLAHELLKEE